MREREVERGRESAHEIRTCIVDLDIHHHTSNNHFRRAQMRGVKTFVYCCVVIKDACGAEMKEGRE